MALSRNIDITPEQRGTVRSLLARHLPDTEAWAYGSRVRWTARPSSDLDMVVFATPEQARGVSDLREAFEESDLPFRVDLFVWDEVPQNFRDSIRADHAPLTGEASRPEWPTARLGSLVTFLSGGTPSKSAPHYWGGSIPWVSAKDMKRFRLADTQDHITADGAANGTRVVPKGTVLLLARGMTLLNSVPVCVLDRDMAFNQDVKALRPGPAVVPEYLPYLVLGNTRRLRSLVDLAGHGTGRLNSEELRAFTVRIPPAGEQRAIAHILGTLDDKIELNRRMNETLEAMARSLFRSWFVDFEPVRAKMEGRDPGLPESIAKLFPDALDDQGRPSGWMSQRLNRLFDVSIGRTPPRKERHHFVQGGMGETWLSIKTMGSIQTFATASDEDLTPDAVERFRVPLIPAGTVMVSFKLTVGRVAIAARNMYSNEAIAHLRARTDTPVASAFTYCYMKEFDYDTLGSTSSIATAVNSKSIKAIEMLVPQAATHAAFEAVAQPVFERILQVTRQTEALKAIRDALLPKLISGEVRATEAETAVEGVTESAYA